MAGFFTPTSKNLGGIPNLKLTPTNSPVFLSSRNSASIRSTSKGRQSSSSGSSSSSSTSPFSDCGLALKRVIGCSTTAFDSHPPSRSFAYTAGAAAVVVQLDDDLQITQRFFRARPNAPTLTSTVSYAPSTPGGYSQETRNRTAASLRDAGIGYIYSNNASPFSGEDSPSSRTWTARERIKAATCLSFSPDGKWIAVGETGYNPRILIFSLSKDVPSDLPVAAMSEHTFGVRGVAFSPCSKYLASIGTMNDGFVYVWSLNGTRGSLVRLHSSNKCTSFVRQIAWMGKSLVTVGTRHVKIWKTEDEVSPKFRKSRHGRSLIRRQQKPASPGPRVLHGRNALLGAMSDLTMSCVVGISDDKALVCTEKGDICLLDEGGLRFSRVASAEFGVGCITVDAESKFAWVAGRHGNIRFVSIPKIVPSTPPESPSSSRSSSPILPYGCRPAHVLAMASMLGHLFTLDSNHSLKIINMSTVDGVPVPNSMIRELPAHKDACLGVRLLPANHSSHGLFFTWSAGGAVLFWSLEGAQKGEFQVELEQPMESEDDAPNELKVVRVSDRGDIFVAGDKYGVLRVIDGKSHTCQYVVKAHSGEIMDITVHQSTIVSCARDRTVQVFTKTGDGWSLAQTLDDHTASVSRVLLLENGNKLLSCSVDRTIVVRELCRREAIRGTFAMAYLAVRTITTKASPVHMTPFSDATLIVSTMDRQIHKFDLNAGKSVHAFRCTDESGDAVVMDAITVGKDKGYPRSRILAGISTTDKSIRLYDLAGNLIDKEWGHTEGVSDVALLERDPRKGEETGQTIVISTGTDGTIMVWEFNPKAREPEPAISAVVAPPEPVDSSSTRKEMTATRPPLRRVLSRSELMDFSPKTAPVTPNPRPLSAHVPSSPPRTLRRKTSAYGMNRSMSSKGGPNTPMPPTPSTTTTEDSVSPSTPVFTHTTTTAPNMTPAISAPSAPSTGRESRKSTRHRTPSPPDPTKNQNLPPPPQRRGSSMTRPRGKSIGSPNDPNSGSGSMNGLAESLSRSLRSFRKKIDSPGSKDGIRPEVLKDLQRELALTAKELGLPEKGEGKSRGRTHGSARGTSSREDGRSEIMAQLLDQYSERLVSLVSDRLDNGRNKLPKDRKKLVDTSGEG
ncbi:WD40 repeat-like protein [Tuber magnatum]|uniref:WD40 repeat-like protein n=1 Tax=Tuber magnatum TaxID=42249 RepID=A0A317SUU3_9PEZI|nr:WD40 repeat-like protein [Tuber magnatum]